jgi:hypothetical protein
MRRLAILHRKSGPYTEFVDPVTKEEFFVSDMELMTLPALRDPPPPKLVSIETFGGKVLRGFLKEPIAHDEATTHPPLLSRTGPETVSDR